MSDDVTVAILGAGISGLSAAWALQKNGVAVAVYEQNNHVGGVMQTYSKNGWLMEEGPNTLLVRDQKIWDLLDELKLKNCIQKPGSEAKKRYILRDKKLVAAPMSFTDFLKTDLLSFSAKLRLLKEPFTKSSGKKDETIADFTKRRLGTEPLDYAVNPFVSGIYAGDPQQLSVKHTFGSLFEKEQQYGSIIKGFIKQKKSSNSAERALISFDEGLQMLPQTIAKKLGNSLHLNAEIKRVSKSDKGWKLQLQSNEEHKYKVIISTIPAYALPGILETDDENSLKELKNINYAPMSSIGLGFRREQVRHPLDGFGMLIPEKEPFSLLGCLFSSSLFGDRAPKNHVLLTCFMGGARHPQLAVKPTEELVKKIKPQLRDLLGVEGEPVFRHHQFWPKAIPQYEVGYDQYLQAMDEIESANVGLILSGNYRHGVSVPDCILNGFKAAERVQQFL